MKDESRIANLATCLELVVQSLTKIRDFESTNIFMDAKLKRDLALRRPWTHPISSSLKIL